MASVSGSGTATGAAQESSARRSSDSGFGTVAVLKTAAGGVALRVIGVRYRRRPRAPGPAPRHGASSVRIAPLLLDLRDHP
jgi:hypothetical protein